MGPGKRLGTILSLAFTGGTFVLGVYSKTGDEPIDRPLVELPTFPTTSVPSAPASPTTAPSPEPTAAGR